MDKTQPKITQSKKEDFIFIDEWIKEIDRRSKEIKLGKVKLYNNEEVLAKFGL